MMTLNVLIKRNVKLFFKDKGMFFSSLITPLILLVLYSTFLSKIYRDSFKMSIPESFSLSEKVIDGCVGGELISSLLAVSCVTVAFCSNMLMVQDKALSQRVDLSITPVKNSTLSLSYYLASAISTLIVCLTALAIGLVYIAFQGWYLSFVDVLLIVVDVVVLVMFGTALSSIINIFLSSQGQISAVGTIVSAGYGFICGAYMPISSFPSGLQKIISFLPGTYGTSLIRNHCMRGTFAEMQKAGISDEIIQRIKDSIDCNLRFFDNKVSVLTMFFVMIISVAILIVAYVIIHKLKSKKVN